MKSMSLAAKLCSICAIIMIYLFIGYMTKMEIVRSDSIYLYTNESGTYFYSSEDKDLYYNNQIVQICTNDGIYHDAKIVSVKKHGMIVDNMDILVYQIEMLDDDMCINDSTYNICIKYDSFLQFLLTSFQNR